jgi:hypothetical protein
VWGRILFKSWEIPPPEGQPAQSLGEGVMRSQRILAEQTRHPPGAGGPGRTASSVRRHYVRPPQMRPVPSRTTNNDRTAPHACIQLHAHSHGNCRRPPAPRRPLLYDTRSAADCCYVDKLGVVASPAWWPDSDPDPDSDSDSDPDSDPDSAGLCLGWHGRALRQLPVSCVSWPRIPGPDPQRLVRPAPRSDTLRHRAPLAPGHERQRR